MDRETIAAILEEKHNTLFAFLSNQSMEKWETGPEGKWTTGQQVLHLLQSIKALNMAMSLPKFVLKYRYGKANREVRDYDAVVKRYKERIEQLKGGTFGPSKNMKVPSVKEKIYLMDRLKTESKKLQYKTTRRWTDKDLDEIILPHPAMGKMPVRELVMWTAYHTEHHCKQLQERY